MKQEARTETYPSPGDSDNYSVDDVAIVNDDGEWSSGDEPRVQVTLEADDRPLF